MALILKPLVMEKEISKQAKHRCGSIEFESSLQGQWVGPRGKPGDSVKLRHL